MDEKPSNIRSLEDARAKKNTQGKSSSWVQSYSKKGIDPKIQGAMNQAERIVKLEKIVERQMEQIRDLFLKYQDSRSLLFQTLKELQDWKLDRR